LMSTSPAALHSFLDPDGGVQRYLYLGAGGRLVVERLVG